MCPTTSFNIFIAIISIYFILGSFKNVPSTFNAFLSDLFGMYQITYHFLLRLEQGPVNIPQVPFWYQWSPAFISEYTTYDLVVTEYNNVVLTLIACA